MVNKTTIGLALVAVVIAILAYFHTGTTIINKTVGGVASSCGGSLTCLVGDFLTSGAFYLGAGNPSQSLAQTDSYVATNSGSYVGSSTQSVISNPFTATSTATLEFMQCTGQATTSVLTMGTTTKSVGLASTDVSVGFLNTATLATTSGATFVGGQTTTLGSGQVSAGSGTAKTIVVGPSENVAIFATSTTAGMGLNYTAGITCAGKLHWTL